MLPARQGKIAACDASELLFQGREAGVSVGFVLLFELLGGFRNGLFERVEVYFYGCS